MSYVRAMEMAESVSLTRRITAAAAAEGVKEPESWVYARRWSFFVMSDWVAAWDYAEQVKSINQNPDTGARTDVITDQMILSAVQSRVNEERLPVPPPPE